MKKETKTIRLIYPQWQGANIVKLITEVENPNDASRGYFLGAQLLNFLAPDNGQETLTVPVSTEITNRKVTDGVLDRDIIVRQTRRRMFGQCRSLYLLGSEIQERCCPNLD